MPAAPIRVPRREAQVLRALQARARGGVAELLTADLARDVGLTTGNAGCVLRSLTEAGIVANIERGSRTRPGRWRVPSAPVVEVNRPRGPAPASGPAAGRREARHAAVAPILFDWIAARLDGDGTIEMGTRAMADGVGIGVSTAETLLARWKAIGAVRVLRRGGPRAVTYWWFEVAMRDAAAGCAAVHPSKTGSTRTGGASRGLADGAEPPLRAPAPSAVRCPFCEMPPGHALCRHGWDGMTTRGQRRMIAESLGGVATERSMMP
jgi:hypothetical protein